MGTLKQAADFPQSSVYSSLSRTAYPKRMKRKSFKRKHRIPPYLVPDVRKRLAAEIYADVHERWQLFAEGCLRNRYFHQQTFSNRPNCMACSKRFNRDEAKVKSRIEKHHHIYLRLCVGQVLDAESDDIYRDPVKGEFDQVPDCRRCHQENPEYFEGCRKAIYPVHASCHEQIHDLEAFFIEKRRGALLKAFHSVA